VRLEGLGQLKNPVTSSGIGLVVFIRAFSTRCQGDESKNAWSFIKHKSNLTFHRYPMLVLSFTFTFSLTAFSGPMSVHLNSFSGL
jgi:hypothetical protein